MVVHFLVEKGKYNFWWLHINLSLINKTQSISYKHHNKKETSKEIKYVYVYNTKKFFKYFFKFFF